MNIWRVLVKICCAKLICRVLVSSEIGRELNLQGAYREREIIGMDPSGESSGNFLRKIVNLGRK